MWIKYSLITVVIYSLYQDMQYYFYEPFQQNHQSDSLEINNTIDVWGQIKIVHFNTSGNLCENILPQIPITFNSYPLRSYFFYKRPSSINWTELPNAYVRSVGDIRNYSEFGGFDGIFFANLMKALNITPKIRTSPVPSFGFQDDNGIFHGTIGKILYGNMTISVNPHFIIDCQTNDIEYLFPIFFDQLCVIAPKALRVPQSVAVFKCYKPMTWLLLVFTFILLGIIWYLLQIYGKKFQIPLIFTNYIELPKKENSKNLYHYYNIINKFLSFILNMWMIMTSGAIPIHFIKLIPERIFLIGCLIFSLIIDGIFIGSLTTSFTTISYYKDINTLKKLSESNLYNIHTTSKFLPIFGNDSGNIIMANLNKKFKLVPNATLAHVAYDRDYCVMEQSSDYLIAKDQYRSEDGAFLLHLIKECPRAFYSTYVVRKGWPLVERFNDIIMRFASGGFYTLWYNSVRNAIFLRSSINRNSNYKNLTRRPFTLNDTQLAFFVLIIGSFLSFGIFLCEYFGKRNKNFNYIA